MSKQILESSYFFSSLNLPLAFQPFYDKKWYEIKYGKSN